MKTYISILLFVGLCFIPFQSFSQNYFDIGNISNAYQIYDTGFETNTLSLKLNSAFEINNADLILISYHFKNTAFQNLKQPELDLFTNSLLAGYLHFWNEKKWSYLAQIKLRHNSDLHRPALKDFRVASWILFGFQKNEHLKLSVGLYYNREFHKALFFPLFGIDWSIDEKWNLFILVPSHLRFEYTLQKENWYLGVESEWSLDTYRIRSQEAFNYFLKEDLFTYFFVEKKLTGNFITYIHLGNSQINKLEIYDKNNQLIPVSKFESDLLKNIGLRAGIAYRLGF